MAFYVFGEEGKEILTILDFSRESKHCKFRWGSQDTHEQNHFTLTDQMLNPLMFENETI